MSVAPHIYTVGHCCTFLVEAVVEEETEKKGQQQRKKDIAAMHLKQLVCRPQAGGAETVGGTGPGPCEMYAMGVSTAKPSHKGLVPWACVCCCCVSHWIHPACLQDRMCGQWWADNRTGQNIATEQGFSRAKDTARI